MSTHGLLDLRKFVSPEFVFGPDSIELAGQYAHNLGMTRVMVVSDPGVQAVGWTGRVEDSLTKAGLRYVTFTNVSPNPRDHEVMAGAEQFQAEECDGIVVVGGGSPMDLAKGIGIVVSNQRHVLEFEGVDNVARPSPPLICIPTTAGSSADVSQFAIITDTTRKVKIAIVSKAVVADAALIDASTTTTMDYDLTRDTGLDALTHAIEAHVSNAHGPVTDMFALQAIERITQHLPTCMDDPKNLEARSHQMLGSMYAGLAFSNAILGAVHAMAHSLGGLLDLPHGQCNAILLDHVMEYNFPATPHRYAQIGKAMGADIRPGMPDDELKDCSLLAIREFKKRVGMTATLGQLGVTEADIDNLARFALEDPCMATNPQDPDLEGIKAVFKNAL